MHIKKGGTIIKENSINIKQSNVCKFNLVFRVV